MNHKFYYTINNIFSVADFRIDQKNFEKSKFLNQMIFYAGFGRLKISG